MPIIKVENLVKRFGSIIAVNNISFNVEKRTRYPVKLLIEALRFAAQLNQLTYG